MIEGRRMQLLRWSLVLSDWDDLQCTTIMNLLHSAHSGITKKSSCCHSALLNSIFLFSWILAVQCSSSPVAVNPGCRNRRIRQYFQEIRTHRNVDVFADFPLMRG